MKPSYMLGILSSRTFIWFIVLVYYYNLWSVIITDLCPFIVRFNSSTILSGWVRPVKEHIVEPPQPAAAFRAVDIQLVALQILWKHSDKWTGGSNKLLSGWQLYRTDCSSWRNVQNTSTTSWKTVKKLEGMPSTIETEWLKCIVEGRWRGFCFTQPFVWRNLRLRQLPNRRPSQSAPSCTQACAEKVCPTTLSTSSDIL